MSTKVKRYGKVIILLTLMMATAIMVALLCINWRTALAQNSDPQTDIDPPAPVVLSRTVEEVVSARDYNHRVWRVERQIEIIDPDTDEKTVELQFSRIVEVGSGVCYRDIHNDWQITDTRWRATRDGFVMDRADYKLQIGPTLDSWLHYTVDDAQMQLRPAALKADDGDYLEDIARINPRAQGFIDADDPSRLVFVSAFGEGINLEIQAGRDGFHQNVIFLDPPQLPGNLDPNRTYIRIYTQLNLDDYIQNQDMAIVIGTDVITDLPQSLDTTPTLRNIEFVKTWNELDYTVSSARHQLVDSRIFDGGQGNTQQRAVAYKQLYRGEGDRTFLVETLEHGFFARATYPIIWDYVTRNNNLEQDENWYADTTYYISSNLSLINGAQLRIEPGTVVKLAPSLPSHFLAKRAILKCRHRNETL